MAVFAGARTQDLMGLSIRLAGFRIKDTLGWITGSGMPKSHNISKAIDKRRDDYPAIREVVMFIREAVAASTVDRSQLDEALGGSAVMAHFLAPSRSNAGCPKWDQWQTLKSILNFGDEMDAEVWRLNGRKGTPGEAWEKREVVGKNRWTNSANHFVPGEDHTARVHTDITAPATSEAQRWDGWGTALKPAIEPIILARKPLDGTVANNVLVHGVGGLNIDACRVATDDDTGRAQGTDIKGGNFVHGTVKSDYVSQSHAAGRFPANVLLDEHAAKEMDKQSGWQKDGTAVRRNRKNSEANPNGIYSSHVREAEPDQTFGSGGGASRFFPVFKSEGETPETKGRFPANVLLDEHAAKEMDKQSGVSVSRVRKHRDSHVAKESTAAYGDYGVAGYDRGTSDEGGASRFFPVFKYQAKAPKKERPVIEREDGSKIQHNTVKPLALMEWLVSLIVPPGGDRKSVV